MHVAQASAWRGNQTAPLLSFIVAVTARLEKEPNMSVDAL